MKNAINKSVVAQQAPVTIEDFAKKFKAKVDAEYIRDGYEEGDAFNAFNTLKTYQYLRKAMLYTWYNGGCIDMKIVYMIYNNNKFSVLTKGFKYLLDYKSPFFCMYEKNENRWELMDCNKQFVMQHLNDIIKEKLPTLFE